MKMYSLILLAVTTATLAVASAPERERPSSGWEAQCSIAEGPSRIVFRSKSGDVTEDDMSAVAVWPDGTKVELPIAPAWFVQRRPMTPEEKPCNGVHASLLASGKILLWIAHDGRPGWDRLTLVLLDSNRRVLDVKNDAGMLSNEFMILPKENAFDVLMLEDQSVLDRGDGEFYPPVFKRIRIRNNKVVVSWWHG